MDFNFYFLYDPETGALTSKMQRGPVKAGDVVGSAAKNGYLYACANYRDFLVHRIAWEIYYGEPAPLQIDHINCERSDNRIINLRAASNSKNSMNRAIQANNSSGFKGVSLHKASGLWFAYATLNGKRISGGYHKQAQDAAAESERLRNYMHEEFSRHR